MCFAILSWVLEFVGIGPEGLLVCGGVCVRARYSGWLCGLGFCVSFGEVGFGAFPPVFVCAHWQQFWLR